jgi:RND superfamily putative drug exporter
LAVIYSLTFLPALLAVLGPRVNAWPVFRPSQGRDGESLLERADGRGHGPSVEDLAPVTAALLLLGSPFTRIRLGASDIGILPPTAEARQGEEILRREFPDRRRTASIVVLDYGEGSPLTTSRIDRLYDYARHLAEEPGVSRVDSFVTLDPRINRAPVSGAVSHAAGARPPMIQAALAQTVGQHTTILVLHTPHAAGSDEAQALVRRIRAEREVADARVLVTGHTAFDLDFTGLVRIVAPRAVGGHRRRDLLSAVLAAGSLLLPIKAVIMNFLSISARTGH